MLTRWLLAAVHLLGLGIGLGAVWARGQALRGPLDRAGLNRVFVADAWWGAAAAVWIGSGLWRLLAGTEKPTGYYLQNHVFWFKMACLAGILLLEIAPMMAFIRWRRLAARGEPIDMAPAARYSTISFVEAGLILAMVLAATAMARGVGARS